MHDQETVGRAVGTLSMRRSLLTATALSTAVLMASGHAIAQSASGGADEEETLEEVVVTGSRLVRQDLVATSPVLTVGSDTIRSSGNVTLEETLNEFPQLNPDTTSTTNQSGGSGVLTADLRGLGAVRTLVLVDGRRFVPGNIDGLADLAAIPDMLIERVEIISGGASAVYGSDAIAGAVNFILRDDFEGIEARYQYGQSDEGDGNSHKVDVLMGMNANDGRGNITLQASYTKRDPVFMGDRAFSAQPLLADSQGVLQPFGSGNIPGGLIGINSSLFDQINGVDLVNADCPGPVQGVRFGADGAPAPFCRPTDQFNYADENFLLRPLERWQFTTSGHYEISDSVEAYGQLFYTKNENAFQQAPEAVSPTSFGQENGTLVIPNADTNPLFPEPLRDFFAANTDFFDEDGDGVFVVRNTGRRFEEFGPRNVSFVTDSLNMTGGLRGTLDIGEKTWRWDSFYQYQRADVNTNRSGLLSRSRTTLGLDVVVVDGVPQCRIDLLNCVPVNLFGTDTLTPEMADFLSVSTSQRDEFTRQVAGASIAGDLFELPAGAVSSAFGVEWRKETFDTVPDEIALSGDLASQAVAPIINSGQFDLFELFAEVRVPLLADMPGVESLALEGAVRYSDYSTIGGVVTWKSGLDWLITEGVRARASYSRAIRAPNLNELFAAPTTGFIGGVDPCVAANNPSQAVKDLCLQQGVPAEVVDTLDVGASQGFNTFSGGNPNLDEEQSDTLTVGAVFTPAAVPGLSVTIDYFDIKVDDAVAQVGAQLLVDTCFANLDINSTACQSITRLSSGNIDEVAAPLLNVARRQVRGVDLMVNYGLDLPDAIALPGEGATLDLRMVSTWQFEDTTVPIEGQAEIDCAGFYGGPCSNDGTRITPDFRAMFTAAYSSGPLQLRNELRYIGDLELSELAFPNENGTVGAEIYWDLTVNYQLMDNVGLFAGVNNLLDNDPPVLGFRAGGDANTNVQLYDPIGRRFFFGATLSF